MSQAKPEIWGLFGPDFSSLVAAFANEIDTLDCDVIVATARKATCLVDALRRTGRLSADRLVVSDRVLDMDTAWLAGKRVGLVDELLISGSTLHRLRAELSRHSRSVDLRVAAADATWWNPDVIQPGGNFSVLEHAACLQFSRNTVLALALLPRTYNLDWPLLEVPVSRRRAQALGAMSAFDITTSANGLQRREGVRSYTFEASHFARTLLDASLDRAVSNELALLKVRVMMSAPGGRHTLNVIPMAVLDKTTFDDIDNMFEAIVTSLGRDLDAAARIYRTRESRLRLIQHTIAARLGRIWVEQYNLTAGLDLEWRPSSREAGYLFTPDGLPVAMQAATSLEPLLAHYQPAKTRAGQPREEHKVSLPLKPRRRDQLSLLQAQLTHPFLSMFAKRELTARRTLKTHGAQALRDPRFKQELNRLSAGITVQQLYDLVQRAQPSLSPDQRQQAVSSFIDLAVDEGIAVPVTATSGKALVRAYRHGEDVNFGERELGAAAQFFAPIFAHSRGTPLKRLDTEKLIAIMLRVGFDRDVFQPWNGRMGEGGVGPRWNRHGVVARSKTSTHFRNEDGEPLSELLVERKVLALKDNRYVKGNATDFEPLEGRQGNELTFMGQTLGAVLFRAPQPLLTSNELALLVSCGRLPDAVKALAAEVKIALPLIQQYATSLSAPNASPARRLSGATAMAGSAFYASVESGMDKFEAYGGDRLTVIRDRVSADLADTVFERATWNSICDTLLDTRRQFVSTEAERLLGRLDRWLRSVHLAVRVGAIAARLANGRGISADIAAVDQMVGRLPDEPRLTRISGWWNRKRPLVTARKADPAALVGFAASSLLDAIPAGMALMDEAEAMCAPDGGLRRTRSFDSVLMILEPGADSDSHDMLSDRLLAELNAAIATRFRVDGVIKTQLPSTIAGSGAVLVAAGGRALEVLCDVAVDLLGCARAAGSDVKLALIPELRSDHRLLHARATADYYGERFFEVLRTCRTHLLDTVQATNNITIYDTDPQSRDIAARIQARVGVIAAAEVHASPQSTPDRPSFASRVKDHDRPWAITNLRTTPMRPTSVDVGIITVKPVETRAVLDLMTAHGLTEDVVSEFGRIRVGTMPGADGDCRVALVQCLDPTSHSASSALQALTQATSPDTVALVGIAGGFRGRCDLGDVVIADQIIDYDQRKVTDKGEEWRGRAYVVDARIRTAIQDLHVTHGVPAALDDGHGGTFKVFEGPLGTGGAVIATEEAEERQRLTYFNGKTFAVETEAAGIAQSFYEQSSRPGYPRGYLVIRGISDMADAQKDDAHHEEAAANAARTLGDLLACGHLRPRTS